jgi:PAS domain S-box-containing protein
MSSAATTTFFAFQLATGPSPALRLHLGPAWRRRQAWPNGHSFDFRAIYPTFSDERPELSLLILVKTRDRGEFIIFTSRQPACAPSHTATPEEMVGAARTAARRGESELRAVLETMPAPIYVTDAQGWITFYNQACVDFAGRTPTLGEDRWCVTWKLFGEDGTALPHEHCPMAVAIREKREVRDAVALAERPDGTRVMFTPYPTPLFDEAGEIAGAVNILIDVTDHRQAAALRTQALRCRRLAQSVTDRRAVDTLLAMASEYDAKAKALRGASPR